MCPHRRCQSRRGTRFCHYQTHPRQNQYAGRSPCDGPCPAKRMRRNRQGRTPPQLGHRLCHCGCAVVVHAVDRSRSSGRHVGVDQLLHIVASRAREKSRRRVSFFVMTLVQVVAQAELQGQALSGLPIILEIGAHLEVPPVPLVALQLRIRNRDVCRTAGSSITSRAGRRSPD